MCPGGDTQYFLEVEWIVLDQHFKANTNPKTATHLPTTLDEISSI
jgi:hypothetical protein